MNVYAPHKHLLQAAVFTLGLLLLPFSLSAQQQAQDPPTATDVIELHATMTRADGAGPQLATINFLEAQPTAQQIDTLVEGLKHLATQHASFRVRRKATSSLFRWATGAVLRDPQHVVSALQFLYDAPDRWLKATVAQRASDLGADEKILAFLRSIAVEPESPWGGIQARALESLATLGGPGRAVLRELHSQDLVEVPAARFRLEDLAETDFRIRGGG